jgi:SAM-dependent methyltransferase
VTQPRLYGELADWFHLLTAPAGYVEEANIFAQTFEAYSRRPVHTMLELGSGGGNNASHLKKRYTMTLTDLSEDMLRLSRTINPECEHIQGDMRTLRLGRRFDAVFVHDAIAYLTEEADLEAAMRTAYEHLETDGIALFVPDDTTEILDRRASFGGRDSGAKKLRYLEWPHELKGTSIDITFVYVLRDGSDERVEVDRHTVGVFPRATWLGLLEKAGFVPDAVPYLHSSFAPDAGHELFIGLKV